MNVSQALKDVENSVRNIISYQLNKQFGVDWIMKSGVSEDRLQSWKVRQLEELKRIGTMDDRLIYYSDFYDLINILKKHWGTCFSTVFGKQNRFEALWEILETFRNPEAHRRELLPYQRNLILGISGKIRTEITSFFSRMETGESYFPRLEAVYDNLGNSWTYGTDERDHKVIFTKMVLRPGDILQFTATAFDPLGEPLLYYFITSYLKDDDWTADSYKTIDVTKDHIRSKFAIEIGLKSNRSYHATSFEDDSVRFIYTVLPSIV